MRVSMFPLALAALLSSTLATPSLANVSAKVVPTELRPAGPKAPSPQERANSDPCERRGEARKSELCAAWEAADAAREGVETAKLQLNWSVAGLAGLLLTLLASLWAAWAATRAAKAAEQSVTIAETTARMQLRAYLSVLPVEIDDLTQNTSPVIVRLPVQNTGSTPASQYTIRMAWRVSEEPPSSELFDKLLESYRSAPREHSMGPHQTKTIMYELNLGPEYRAKVLTGLANLYFLGEITYRDVFGEPRKTEFFYKYNRVLPNRLGQVPYRNVIQ